MNIESGLRKVLEENGFQPKNVKSFDWSYKHHIYGVVVYRAKKGFYYIYFNKLSDYMRKYAQKEFDVNDQTPFAQREQIYRNILSSLDYFDEIKNHISFSFRTKVGGNYVGISEDVGLPTLKQVLDSVMKAGDGGYNLFESIPSHRSHNKNIAVQEIYLPTKTDVEYAYSQLLDNSEGNLDRILDKIEENVTNSGKLLKSNWRMITERNIKIWFK